ncbi:MAG: hypothetical protein U1F77_16510 [Kiritimatiellia bacterium]
MRDLTIVEMGEADPAAASATPSRPVPAIGTAMAEVVQPSSTGRHRRLRRRRA